MSTPSTPTTKNKMALLSLKDAGGWVSWQLIEFISVDPKKSFANVSFEQSNVDDSRSECRNIEQTRWFLGIQVENNQYKGQEGMEWSARESTSTSALRVSNIPRRTSTVKSKQNNSCSKAFLEAVPETQHEPVANSRRADHPSPRILREQLI